MLASSFGCPRVPDTMWFTQTLTIGTTSHLDSETTLRSHLLGPFSEDLITLNICNMRQGYNPPTASKWGPGDYCLLMVNRDKECDDGTFGNDSSVSNQYIHTYYYYYY